MLYWGQNEGDIMTWTTVCLLDGCAKAMEEDILAVFGIKNVRRKLRPLVHR